MSFEIYHVKELNRLNIPSNSFFAAPSRLTCTATGVAGEQTCAAAAMAVITALFVVKTVLQVALKVVEALYGFLVTKRDYFTDRDLSVSSYDNIITTAQIKFSTYRSVQKVKQLLGELSTDLLRAVKNDRQGRRLTNECLDTDKCPNPPNTQNCDCSNNYDYIKMQPEAGCKLQLFIFK